jgi:hypothetical protein
MFKNMFLNINMNPTAVLINNEIKNYVNFTEIKKTRTISFYHYALSYYGLSSSGNRYCQLCRKKYPKYFDDFCEYCGGLCLKCCKNTEDCWKYR